MSVSIVAWSHTPFGKHPDKSLEDLLVMAARGAIAHAEISPDRIDELFVGHFNSGFSHQSLPAGLVLQADPLLRFKPATRVENACASGSAAVFQGIRTIEAGAADIVLVVGAEKMTDTKGDQVGRNLLGASYLPEDLATPAGFAGVFGIIATEYFHRFGDQTDALARIAAKNHRNGVYNPWAQLRKDLGVDFCRVTSQENPVVAGPLKRSDCSPVSDGAAALILARDDIAQSFKQAVRFRGTSHIQDILPRTKRDVVKFEGCAKAWAHAFSQARLKLEDLNLVETHDCFTIAELIEYEAMGLTPEGKGAMAIIEGWTHVSGRLPINPSGGLKAKGHPIGATGVSMHILASMQLCDQAPAGIQISSPTIAGVFNMGGAAVANYVSILERWR